MKAIILLNGFLQILSVYGNGENLGDYQEEINDISRIARELIGCTLTKSAFLELRKTVQRDLIRINAKLFADAINAKPNVRPQPNIKQIYNDIRENYNYDNFLVEEIFLESTKQFISNKRVSQLPFLVWRIYSQNDYDLFVIMLNVYLSIFFTIRGMDEINTSQFLPNYSFILYRIKSTNHYQLTDKSLQSSADAVIELLPNNCKYLFFKNHFCLLNAEYSEFMFASRGSIWLWRHNKTMDDRGYIKAEFGEGLVIRLDTVTVRLKSILDGEYYSFNSVNDWTIRFEGNDNVSIHQDLHYLCAAEIIDNLRRNVIVKIPDAIDDPACIWRLGSCEFP